MDVNKADTLLNILFVYSRVPFPMLRGDQLTVAHLVEYLSARGHAIDLVTLDDGGTMTEQQETWIHSRCRTVQIVPHTIRNKTTGIIKALIARDPIQVGYYSNKRQHRTVSALQDRRLYDVAYVYYARSGPVLSEPHQPDMKTFLALQLSQALNCDRISATDRNPIKRNFFRMEARRMQRFESKIWSDYDKVGLIGDADLNSVRYACHATSSPTIDNAVLTPHGTDLKRFSPRKRILNYQNSRYILFSGNLSYEPNIRAIEWFVHNCWLDIARQVDDVKLRIIGRSPSPVVTRLAGFHPSIQVVPNVPAIADHIQEASVCINPMQAAAGMQNKLLEYLACGRPVVATSIANEGLNLPTQYLTIANSSEDFTKGVVELLDNPVKGEKMGRAARRFVVKNWSWEHHFAHLESHLIELAGRS